MGRLRGLLLGLALVLCPTVGSVWAESAQVWAESAQVWAGPAQVWAGSRSLVRSVQEDVCFRVEVSCGGCVPVFQWSFMSASVSRGIGSWQQGNFTNITEDYSARVRAFNNGSMLLTDLRLQDAGFYVVTVTASAGSSKDVGFVLKVTEVLYEDLQYLSVSALALACVAALLMLFMWLLNKLYRRVWACRRRRRMPEADATELQPL